MVKSLIRHLHLNRFRLSKYAESLSSIQCSLEIFSERYRLAQSDGRQGELGPDPVLGEVAGLASTLLRRLDAAWRAGGLWDRSSVEDYAEDYHTVHIAEADQRIGASDFRESDWSALEYILKFFENYRENGEPEIAALSRMKTTLKSSSERIEQLSQFSELRSNLLGNPIILDLSSIVRERQR